LNPDEKHRYDLVEKAQFADMVNADTE